ncbi:MAG: peptide chain release factor 1 [Gammaproteobacteria bacterium RIFCSPHIGHO2_12_FULL_43_28]|nr:MAG: peptide chain release factor 1 [Gammaproteobacteria bacterium RIFCSPHIGHO2_12_FULL_43_28]
MKPSIRKKLQHLTDRYNELKTQLSDPAVTDDLDRYKALSKEYSQHEPFVASYQQYQSYEAQLDEAKALLDEGDHEMQQLAKDEIKRIEAQLEAMSNELLVSLLPKDPHDENNIFLEIRAGTGGDEAAIFAGDLCRMYMRYAEAKHFKIEIMSESTSEQGGYKEVIMRIIGHGAYSLFKFESGVHRVQRVPATEAQGRIHTSTCTVAVLPELEEVGAIDINPTELRIDTFRASGAGGQHVQKTDSAIRITHLPSGLVVECQDERSQHKNRARAMSLLKAKLLASERDKQQKQQAEARRQLVGSGDRSERIRTYNFPQGRLTDHRINLTLYQLPQIMEGDLTPVIEALSHEYNADLIASLGD